MLNVEVNRLELLSAAQDAEKLAPNQSPVKVLECTYLAGEGRTLTLQANNLETALERRVPAVVRENGAFAVNAKLLTAMLRLLEGETVSLIQRDKYSVTLRAGDAVYTVLTQDTKDYPTVDIPQPENTVTLSGLPTISRRTLFATGSDETHPLLQCVRLTLTESGLKAVGSDGIRIAAAKGEGKGEPVELLLPAAALEKLSQMVSNKDELRVGITDKEVVFTKENFLFSTRKMAGSYLDTDRVLNNAKPSFVLLADADALRESLVQTVPVSGNHPRFSVSFGGNVIKMACESPWGRSSTELEAVALSGTPAGTFWYNPDLLLGCLKALRGRVLWKVCQSGMLVLETDELICLQMAMREPRPHEAEKKPKQKKEKPPQKEAA